MKRVILLIAAAWGLSCGGGSSPTAPTPSPPTAPAPRVVTFTPETLTPGSQTMSLQNTSTLAAESGKVSIALVATRLDGVYTLRGDLTWNPELLEFDSWAEGAWFKQGNAVVDWAFFVGTLGQIGFVLGRSTNFPAATGSGEIYVLRLRPRAGVTSGSTRLEWEDARLLDEANRPVSLSDVPTGVVTIR